LKPRSSPIPSSKKRGPQSGEIQDVTGGKLSGRSKGTSLSWTEITSRRLKLLDKLAPERLSPRSIKRVRIVRRADGSPLPVRCHRPGAQKSHRKNPQAKRQVDGVGLHSFYTDGNGERTCEVAAEAQEKRLKRLRELLKEKAAITETRRG